MRLWKDNKNLCMLMDGMLLRMMPWGMNSLRVVMQPAGSEDERNWALTEAVPDGEPEIGGQEGGLKAPGGGEGQTGQGGNMGNGRIRGGNNPESWVRF